MLIVRPTASLAKRMKIQLTSSDEVSTTKLGDWFANDFVMNRKQYILCMSTKSKLTVVMQAAPYSKFPYRLENDLFVLLRELGVDKLIINTETDKMNDFRLAKTNDRSVMGVMNQFRQDLEAHCRIGRIDLDDTFAMSLLLSRNITLSLEESYPYRAAFKLLDFKPNDQTAKVIPFRAK